MKVVYNACFGGFSLSEEAVRLGRKISGDKNWGGVCLVGDVYSDGSIVDRFYGGGRDIDRTDPILVQVVETLGKKANGLCAQLEIEDVPAGSQWRIDEYDGNESVMTQSDYAWKVAA